MRLRTLVLALALSSGLAVAADKHPKPPKVAKHVKPPKAGKHNGPAAKPVSHKGPKAAKHPKPPKAPKHKAAKVKKHKS